MLLLLLLFLLLHYVVLVRDWGELSRLGTSQLIFPQPLPLISIPDNTYIIAVLFDSGSAYKACVSKTEHYHSCEELWVSGLSAWAKIARIMTTLKSYSSDNNYMARIINFFLQIIMSEDCNCRCYVLTIQLAIAEQLVITTQLAIPE